MTHKNLITDPRIKEQVEVILNRKSYKCWKTNKVCFNKQGVMSAKAYQENKEHIKLYIYKCSFCRSWHLTKQKNNDILN